MGPDQERGWRRRVGPVGPRGKWLYALCNLPPRSRGKSRPERAPCHQRRGDFPAAAKVGGWGECSTDLGGGIAVRHRSGCVALLQFCVAADAVNGGVVGYDGLHHVLPGQRAYFPRGQAHRS